MILNFTNCNNITSGQVAIAEGCLNIKYGINGTGKSTIAKIIATFVNNDDTLKEELIPYSNVGNSSTLLPNVNGLEKIHSVSIFTRAILLCKRLL